MSYITRDELREEWEEAMNATDRVLDRLIAAAHVQIVEYARPLPAGAEPPANYVQAELMQVRAIGQAVTRDGTELLGLADGFAIRARPLGADVKALLRPKSGGVRGLR